jgi:hypothetical protein
MSTKPTASAFLLPFAIIFPIILFKRTGAALFAGLAAVIVAAVLMNVGHVRNMMTYGSSILR